MNTIFSTKILLFATLAAIAAGFGYSALQPATQTNSSPNASPIPEAPAVATAPGVSPSAAAPPAPAPRSELPPGILPNSPLAQVIKLAQAGLDESILMAYITNCNSTFNLDSEKIIYATDAGVPADVVTVMMQRDQQLRQTAAAPPPSQPQSPSAQTVSAPAPGIPPDPENVNINYFYSTLTPYGTWISIPGYGNCWRPNVAIYDSGWAPYCDRGSWIYTDCGWYWASDYSWGCTFHYGRWFRDPRWGWCWWPDTVWGPSWVTWRYSDNYCGWAPLPPFAVWQPGIGFVYQGNGVSVGFDFGLAPACFVFVPAGNFCDVQLRRCRVPASQVTVVYNRTTVINNININVHRRVVNNGIAATFIAAATHRQIQATTVHDLRNDYYQRVNAVRRDIRSDENQRRANAEDYAEQRIQNAQERQQRQRDRISDAREKYNSGNSDSTPNNNPSWDQPKNYSRQQNSGQNAAPQNYSAQNRAEANANAQRQAVETHREEMRQQIQQEQARQSQAIAEAHAQQQAQVQAAQQQARAEAAQQQARVESARQEVQQRIQAAQSERGNGNGNGNGGNGRGNNAQDRNNH